MTTDALVGMAIDALNACAVPYMVTGSLASNVYGIARMTKDADFVVQSAGSELASVAQRLHPVFRLEPQMAFETITSTHKQVMRHVHSAFTLELFTLCDDPHDQLRFSRRLAATLLDRATWLPTAEDVVIQKLRWSRHGSRNRDVDDARNVINVQADRLDWPYIREWCARHGTLPILNGIQAPRS